MNERADGAIEIEIGGTGGTGGSPAYAVIWLHGLGADGHDFAPVVPALQIPPQVPVRFIFPHAPVRPITVNGGMEMRGWYDIAGADLERAEDRDGIEHSTAILRALIERETGRGARGVQPENIFLAGFSQGGALALHAGLRHPQRLAGIIALSAYLPLADLLETEKSAANQPTPIFIAHGAQDPLIPVHLARRSARRLARAGYGVAWREYPIAHEVCAEEIADVGEFLRAGIG